jgi:hypothetical protein
MNLSKVLSMNDCRWNGLALGLILGVMAAHLTAATNASRSDEPWPMLLSNEPAAPVDPAVTLLQQRASGSLERLVQSAAVEQPL